MSQSVIEDLTINEFYRLLKIVQGKINLEPLYIGLSQYFQNIIDCHSTYLPSSVNQIPFYQEVCIFTWRLMTNNQVSCFRKPGQVNTFYLLNCSKSLRTSPCGRTSTRSSS